MSLTSPRRVNWQEVAACSLDLNWMVEVAHSLVPTHRTYFHKENFHRVTMVEEHIASARPAIDQGLKDLHMAVVTKVMPTVLVPPWLVRRSVSRSYYNTSLREQAAYHIAYIYDWVYSR